MPEPFVPRIAGGRLYGRGSQDMKGGVAAMVAAAAMLAPTWTTGRLVVAAVADEEYESLGALAVARGWAADAAIVTEPTDLRLAIAHKGFAWMEIDTRGRAAHGSRPEHGRDAIVAMGRVLMALEARNRALRSAAPVGLQGTGSLHASTISGGREWSSYPEACRLRLERRTVSGEDGAAVLADVDRLLAALRTDDPEFDAVARLMTFRAAYRIDPADGLVTTMREVLAAGGLDPAPTGMSFWTDASVLADAGTPSVLFGPGGAGLHSVEEYVTVDDVRVCRDVLVETARRITSRA
jgi:acetylornithine deacetylase